MTFVNFAILFLSLQKGKLHQIMHTITLEITNDNALKTIKDLESKHYVNIIDDFEFDPTSPALPGNALTADEFKGWVNAAEQSPAISFKEAKEKWAKQTEKMLKHAK